MASNILRYSIRDELLYGTVADISFSMRAFSGGGRGSTSGIERTDVKHWSTEKKAPAAFDAKNRGGPLPRGHYIARYVSAHPTFGRCAVLEQTITSLLRIDPFAPGGVSVTKRGGFYIHGPGPHGSDGCIVPANKVDYRSLIDAIRSASGVVLIEVRNEGAPAERLDIARSFANVA